MQFVELLSLTKFILNFNDGQADQDFSDIRLKQLLNLVYLDEVNKAKQEGLKRHFRAFKEETWAASAVTYTLPPTIAQAELISVVDVTDNSIGYPISFSEEGSIGLFWKDHNTLQWGLTGPSSARTLRFYYYAQPAELVAEDDVPELIPDAFHQLLAWAAAVYARTIADEAAPNMWSHKLEELRFDYWKYISRGRPISADGGAGPATAEWDVGSLAQDGSSLTQDHNS